jgi:hypothetical protein
MPESKTSEWIWDGSQKNFAIFEDKVFERFIDGNGGRIAQQWYMNSDASITEHNLEEFGNTLWDMQRLEVGIRKADEDAHTDAFWTVEYAESWTVFIAVGARGRCLHLRLRDRSSMR